MMSLLAARALALLLANCHQSSTDPVRPTDEATVEQQSQMLTTDRPTYSRSQDLRLTLTNETQDALGTNLCISTLERRQGEQWIAVPGFPPDPCPALLRIVAPGQSASQLFRLDGTLATGQYRLVTRVEFTEAGEDTRVASNTFQLTD